MSNRPKRVVYGSRPLTAKQLAMYLSKRCMRELPNAIDETKARDEAIRLSRSAEARKAPRPPLRYIIAPARRADEPGAWQFDVAEQRIIDGPREGYSATYGSEWMARIVVTPQLDVEVYDTQGKSDLRAIERVMLGCALRGK